MITGRVSSNVEAIVAISLEFAANRRRKIKAIVDTGFTGFLSLPPALVSRLKLPFRGNTRVVLADGRAIRCDLFQRSDEYAQRKGVSRAALISQGLRLVLSKAG